MATSRNNFLPGDNSLNNPYIKQLEAEQAANDNARWAKMMDMMAAVPKMSDQQMVGYALGKLLRDGFDTWKKNYKDRGMKKVPATPNGGSGNTGTSSDASTSATNGDLLTGLSSASVDGIGPATPILGDSITYQDGSASVADSNGNSLNITQLPQMAVNVYNDDLLKKLAASSAITAGEYGDGGSGYIYNGDSIWGGI